MIALTLALALTGITADPAPKTEGDVTEAKVGAMTVLVKKVPNAELVSTQLYIRGGSRNWSKADAGVEQLALSVATSGGTKSLDKIAFAMKLASLGSFIGSDTGRDWSTIMSKGPLASFDATFAMLAETFTAPALPAAEIEVQRQQQLAGIRHQDEDPDAHLAELVNDTIYKGHPYENHPEGTLDVVQKLTAAQLDAHLQKLREQKRLLLVVVGDVDPAKVIDAARAAFGKVPAGKYAPKALPKPSFKAATLVTEQRELPTNYIQGMTLGPKQGTKDYAAAVALNNMLWERLFEEVRTKRNLSYAPGIRWDTSEAAVLTGIYVTAVDPNATLPVMIDELKKVQKEPLSDTDLAATKAQTRTSMLMGKETTDGQATALARGLLLAGDWRNEKKLNDMINALTSKDLQQYAAKTYGKLQMVMLGDPKKLDEKIAKSF